MRITQNYLLLDREINIYILLRIVMVITTLILRNIMIPKKNNIANRGIEMYSGF